MQAKYPVALFRLGPMTPGYDQGLRYFIETIDGELFYFRGKKAAMAFMELHGLKHVANTEVVAIRESMATTGEWNPENEDWGEATNIDE